MSAAIDLSSAGKIALITGSSRGLGRSAAIALARAGADVIITYHTNEAEARRAVTEVETLGRKGAALQLDAGDINSFKDFNAITSRTLRSVFGRDKLDILINNAGHSVRAGFAETTEAEFDSLMNVHFKGVFFLTQALLPLIADGGRIVNISSGLARFSLPGMSAYAAMKGGIEVLTRYLAVELGPRRITVNVVAPGAIETDFGGGAVRDNAAINANVASMTALGRVGLPEDIGPMIAALVSESNRWVNGQRIEVSGGVYL